MQLQKFSESFPTSPNIIFWIFLTYFCNFLSPNFFPLQECSHPLYPPLPAIHACVYCVFSTIVTTPLPDAHKMGLSGKTFAPHISHKGSLWPITALMEARDSHQLHAFFSSRAWKPAKARLRIVSVVLSLAVVLPMSREVAHSGTLKPIL